MDRMEFYEFMLQEDSPDEMVFDIQSHDPDPEHTFSYEAVGDIIAQVQAFMMARISANSRKTKPLKHARMFVQFIPSVTNDPEDLGLPYYHGEIDNGTTVADGERRMRALDRRDT